MQHNPRSLSDHLLPAPSPAQEAEEEKSERGCQLPAPHLCRRHLRVQRLCPPSLLSPSLWPPGHHSCHCLVCPVRTRREGWTQGLWGLLSHRTPVPSHSILSWLMHIFILQILIKSLLCIEHYTNHLRGARRKKKA